MAEDSSRVLAQRFAERVFRSRDLSNAFYSLATIVLDLAADVSAAETHILHVVVSTGLAIDNANLRRDPDVQRCLIIKSVTRVPLEEARPIVQETKRKASGAFMRKVEDLERQGNSPDVARSTRESPLVTYWFSMEGAHPGQGVVASLNLPLSGISRIATKPMMPAIAGMDDLEVEMDEHYLLK